MDVYLNFRHDNNPRIFQMNCDRDDTIEIVKSRLEDQEGLEPEKIILRWPQPDGTKLLLVNNKNLDDYGLVEHQHTPIIISVKNATNGGGRRRRRRTKRRRTKRKGSKKRSRRTRRIRRRN